MNSINLSRRSFLRWAGIAGIGATAAACTINAQTAPTATPAPVADAHAAPVAQAGDTGMDAMTEAGVKKYLDNIGKQPNFWNNKLQPTMDGDTKVFNVTASDIEWETMPGTKVQAMAYNNVVPGPEIRVTEGDKVRVNFTNNMKQSTAIHFHGVAVPNKVDGVPFVTQPVVKTGENFAYEFVAKNSGSHMYHSHHNAAEQVTRGLLAPFIIEPKDKSKEPKYDSDYTLILNDTALGFTFNGYGFPYTQPIIAKVGEKVRIRYMNEGLLIHPMHLHGLEQQVFAKDGWLLPQPYTCDTLNIAPGERYDVIVNAHSEGVWAFHCHILTHAETAAGMFGMVTTMIVK